MNYTRSLSFLNSFLDLEKLSQFPENPFFNLRRMEHLLKISGHPEKDFFPVLIAGTTGKGSTGFFLESILKANGIRAGYYHSPHVEDPRERIRLQGAMASRELWAEGLSELRALLLKDPVPEKYGFLTYFEAMTFLAMLLFAKKGVQAGIFEIGLGGRLDATNVLKAPLVLLTPIHLDHEAFLGPTVRKIAGEKAAIIKPGNHVVTGKQFPEAFRVIRAAVRKNHGLLWKAPPVRGIPLGLSGDFQKCNAGMALKAAAILGKYFKFSIKKELSKNGLRCRAWKGRMECFRRRSGTFLLDGAHNPISVRQLVRELERRRDMKDAWLVFGAMHDKNSRKMLEILSRFFTKAVLTRVDNPRAKALGLLIEEAKGLFRVVVPARNAHEAIAFVKKVSGSGTSAVITGSFYLVGEARKLLKNGGTRRVPPGGAHA